VTSPLPVGLATVGWLDGPADVLREAHGDLPTWLHGCSWSFPGAEGGQQWRAEPDALSGDALLDLGALVDRGWSVVVRGRRRRQGRPGRGVCIIVTEASL
jgi:hypothetical protein